MSRLITCQLITTRSQALAANLKQRVRMLIDLPNEIETQLKETAQARGVSGGQYVESLVAETNLRYAQITEFRAAIAERMASLNAGESADGEEVMNRLIAAPNDGSFPQRLPLPGRTPPVGQI